MFHSTLVTWAQAILLLELMFNFYFFSKNIFFVKENEESFEIFMNSILQNELIVWKPCVKGAPILYYNNKVS